MQHRKRLRVLLLVLSMPVLGACGGQRVPPGSVGPDGGAGDPDGAGIPAPASTSCPDTLQPGAACHVVADVTCVNPGSVCGVGWGSSGLYACNCTDGTWSCHGAGQAECASGLLPEGTSCSQEGTGTCDTPPAGGSCACTNKTWSCSSSCPSWCPESVPAPGTSPSCPAGAGGQFCYYGHSSTKCVCTGGVLSCSDHP